MTNDCLFYVRYALSVLIVYRCKTNDLYHTMGEMIYRGAEHINRLDFNEWSEHREQFWIDSGYKIHEWVNKYD